MQHDEGLFDEEFLPLPPMLLGTIRWKKVIGRPDGDLSSGFRILVDEREPSEFQVGPAGYEKKPGTGEWRLGTNSVLCAPAAAPADSYAVTFSVPNVHLNGFPDGTYRVTARVTGNWERNWERSLFRYLVGPRRVEPISWYVVLTKDRPVASIDFDVVRRPWFPFLWPWR